MTAVLFVCLWPAAAWAVPSEQLIADAALFEGSTVSYQGEAVGLPLVRGVSAFVSLFDGKNAISVWMPKDFLKNIRHYGRYRHEGDTVSVIGIFHRSCPEHGGGLDIHATYLLVLGAGRFHPEFIAPQKLFTLAGLLGVLICLLIVRGFLMKRKKT